MSSAGTQPEASLASRVQKEVERAIQRNIKGVDYIFASSTPVGLTPKDVILRRGTLSLYHYRPMADEIYRVPVLIVMATTNKGYIVDLAPGQSLIEFLLKQGYDVYMMDWNAPRADEKRLRLEDYALDFIPDCVKRVQERSGVGDVTILGYCMGGVLSAIYAALHPKGPAKNLVCFTTPINWKEMPLFQAWSDRRYFDVDRLVDSVGNVPADFIMSGFDMLRPAGRIAGQMRVWDNMWNDEFVKSFRMFDRWGAETLPLAGEYFRQTTKELLWDNKLYKNELVVGGRRVSLENITLPILHAVAEHDHIVPYAAAKPLIAGVGSADKEEVMLKGGHVSVAAGPNAAKRLWPKLDTWLGERSI